MLLAVSVQRGDHQRGVVPLTLTVAAMSIAIRGLSIVLTLARGQKVVIFQRQLRIHRPGFEVFYVAISRLNPFPAITADVPLLFKQ
jgi:hypothetical protein